MKKFSFAIALILFISLPLSSSDFYKITAIEENINTLINDNFEIYNSDKILNYFVIVSGLMPSEDFDRIFNNWYESIDREILLFAGRTDIANLPIEKRKQTAEKLLNVLHTHILKKYKEHANLISDIINSGEFNCVTSSIIYSAFLVRYGIAEFKAVETNDHVYIMLEFPEENIDIETTSPYGYDPGKKKDVLDSFGKITGFVYVPSTNYRNTNRINLKKLLSLIIHNRAVAASKTKRDYQKAANLAYILYAIRNDSKGYDEFLKGIQNYIADLSDNKQHIEALKTIDDLFLLISFNETFFKMRPVLLGQIINTIKIPSEYELGKNLLLNEYKQFFELYSTTYKKDFVEVLFLLTANQILYHDKTGDYKSALSEIVDFNRTFSHIRMRELFRSIMINIANDRIQNRNSDLLTDEDFVQYRKVFPSYESVISEIEKYFNIQSISAQINADISEISEEQLNSLNMKYPNNKDILALMKYFYVQIGIKYYNTKRIADAVELTEKAIIQFPTDSILRGNLLVYYKKYIDELISTNNNSIALATLKRALARYPGDSHFSILEKNLTRGNYD